LFERSVQSAIEPDEELAGIDPAAVEELRIREHALPQRSQFGQAVAGMPGQPLQKGLKMDIHQHTPQIEKYDPERRSAATLIVHNSSLLVVVIMREAAA